jgi:hypothetical protein
LPDQKIRAAVTTGTAAFVPFQLCRCCRGGPAFYKRGLPQSILSSMTNPELELFDANPEWRIVLVAYQQKIAAGSLEWSPRLTEVEGLAREQLSTIHGKLIALGMLKFEISSRTDGMQYQVTTLGRQAALPPAERQLTPEWLLEAEAPAA